MGVPNMRSVKLPFVSLKSKLNRMYFSNIIWKRGAKRGFTPCLEYLTNYSKHLKFFKNICTMYMYNNYKLSRINVTFLTYFEWSLHGFQIMLTQEKNARHLKIISLKKKQHKMIYAIPLKQFYSYFFWKLFTWKCIFKQLLHRKLCLISNTQYLLQYTCINTV